MDCCANAPIDHQDNGAEPDEGWWAAVLAEEDKKSTTAKSKPQAVMIDDNLNKPDWDYVQYLLEKDEIIILETYSYNRGGLLVQSDRIHGFVPISHLIDMPCGVDEETRDLRLRAYLGKHIRLKVIECDPQQDRVVLSERAALAGSGKRKALIESLKPGDEVCGTVTNITDFGVFVDLGGLEGLIHVSELSWGRVQNPRDILNLDDQIFTVVLNVNEENGRVALSLKKRLPNPWELLKSSYEIGDVTDAIVTSITHFGVFARLDLGIEGLIHVSSLDANNSRQELEKLYPIGNTIRVKIIHIDIDKRRLGLRLAVN